MPKKRKFGDDDLAIWSRVKTSVNPLSRPYPQKENQFIEPPKPSMGPPLGSTMPVPNSPPHIQIELKRQMPVQNLDGLQRSQRRAIKRGHLAPTKRIDLHGLRLEQAHARFRAFLVQAARENHRSVLVITGKGGHKRFNDFGAETSGVIRRAFPEWMREREISEFISHYTPAHVKDGGEGAWYVFIRGDARRKFSK